MNGPKAIGKIILIAVTVICAKWFIIDRNRIDRPAPYRPRPEPKPLYLGMPHLDIDSVRRVMQDSVLVEGDASFEVVRVAYYTDSTLTLYVRPRSYDLPAFKRFAYEITHVWLTKHHRNVKKYQVIGETKTKDSNFMYTQDNPVFIKHDDLRLFIEEVRKKKK